jgi:NAD(P)-dependent dehydrogenase (short-subunit alcohol dehydrogenase family)
MALETGLAGKTALITGASRGIGRATALALAAEGCNIVVSSRRQDALDEVAKEIQAACPGAGVLAHAAHAGEEDQVRACVDAAVATFGSLDVLVSNAGTNPYFGPMIDISESQATKTVQVNQYAIVMWARHAWRAHMRHNGGSIVNVSSVGGIITEYGIGYYNATKAAVIHLTRQLATELAPGVRVNAVAPGLVKTHLARALWEGREEQISGMMPLRRLGEPEDIANAIVFLAGSSASWMTGHTMVVDGGSLVRSSVA